MMYVIISKMILNFNISDYFDFRNTQE